MKTPKVIALSFPFIQSMMTGVAWASFNGNHCTLHYTDGKTETARITAALREQIRAYHRYQAENGAEAAEPNLFSVVSEVQSARSP